MRISLLVALLAASAFIPAIALAQDASVEITTAGTQRDEVRETRRAAREEARAERAATGQAAPSHDAAPQQRGDVIVAGQSGTGGEFRDERRAERQEHRIDRRQDRERFEAERRDDRRALRNGTVTRPEYRADRHDDLDDFNHHRRDDRREYRADRRDDRDDYRRSDGTGGNWYDNSRFGQNYGFRQTWNRDWRRDRRYDWNGYRSYNRWAFNLPRYYAPHGWAYGYRRFDIGFTLNSILFNQSYWIDEPRYYRLPPAYGPYRWVRYYNDALLVDIRSGQVVDMIHDIFW